MSGKEGEARGALENIEPRFEYFHRYVEQFVSRFANFYPTVSQFLPPMRRKLPIKMTPACRVDELMSSEASLDAVLFLNVQSDFRVL